LLLLCIEPASVSTSLRLGYGGIGEILNLRGYELMNALRKMLNGGGLLRILLISLLNQQVRERGSASRAEIGQLRPSDTPVNKRAENDNVRQGRQLGGREM
jgi:hypothetical protein